MNNKSTPTKHFILSPTLHTWWNSRTKNDLLFPTLFLWNFYTFLFHLVSQTFNYNFSFPSFFVVWNLYFWNRVIVNMNFKVTAAQKALFSWFVFLISLLLKGSDHKKWQKDTDATIYFIHTKVISNSITNVLLKPKLGRTVIRPSLEHS